MTRLGKQAGKARRQDPPQAGSIASDVVPGVPADLAHGADEYGSLVTVEPVDWMICFVKGLQKQWWHKFVNEDHKHVFAMRPTGSGSWVLVEPWWTRMMITVLPSADAVRYLRWGATGDILKVKESIPGKANQARGWSNCAVLMAFVLGRTSHSWTPHGLYHELIRDKSVEHQDVEDLLIQQFTQVIGKAASEAARLGAESFGDPVEDVLTSLGRNLTAAMMSPAVAQLCHSAVMEAERYPKASRVYHEQGLIPALTAVENVLKAAAARNEVHIADCRIAAGQFIAMLRGNLHLQETMELREGPSSAEIDIRTKSAVKTFFHGVQRHHEAGREKSTTCAGEAAPAAG